MVKKQAPEGEPTRRCIASGEVLPIARLVRFVAGPDGAVVPDLAGKLPGRGLWVEAREDRLTHAARKGLFARAAKATVRADEGLVTLVRDGLRNRLVASLGLAARAGHLVTGFEKVREALKSGGAGVLVEAADGADDGREKVFALAHGLGAPVGILGVFSGAELDLALGRSNVVHAAVHAGPFAEKMALDMSRLEGFTPLAPAAWHLPGGAAAREGAA